MASKTFKSGVMAPEFKKQTRGKEIIDIAVPRRVILPLKEGPGDPAKPIVKKNDEVRAGQIIAEAQGGWGLPVRASIGGKVEGIVDIRNASGQSGKGIAIAGDGSMDLEKLEPLGNDISGFDPEAIAKRVQEAGILGMGGAGFPTHVKIMPPPDVKIDTVIINGAECEPYLTCDEKVMETRPEEIVAGLRILMRALGAKKGIVGIKSHKKKSIKLISEAAKDFPEIEVNGLVDKYPMGAEKMLIDALTGRRVPQGGLPFHVGVAVNNIQTALAVKEAVLDGIPLIRRVVTVTGSGIKEPGDYRVYIGITVEELLKEAGGMKDNAAKVVAGGPMMGQALHQLETPMGRADTAVLVMTEQESHLPPERPCIRCARCVDHCPVFLNPITLANYSERQNIEGMERLKINDCIECGTCSFVCPAKKPLVQNIILGKGIVREAQSRNGGSD